MAIGLSNPTVTSILARYCTEQAPILVLIMDRDGTVGECNAYVHELLAIPDHPIHFSDLVLQFGARFELERVIMEPDTRHLLNVTTRSGLPQSFYFRFAPIGESIVVIGDIDVNETENLRRSFVELNTTLSTTNRELQKSKAELAKLNEVKNHFLGMAAHDLRNPVGSILHLCKFVLDSDDGSLSSENREFVSMIQSSSSFTLTLLDELLDIARIEAGRLDLSIAETDVHALIHESVGMNQAVASSRDVRIVVNKYEALPDVLLDRTKIMQVLNNLISNAVKFTPEGVVLVRLEGKDGYVQVSVRDTGVGIAPEDHDAVFEQFQQVGDTLTEKPQGTGLGLPICKQIVVHHGGRLWLESALGEGSTFSFSLPAVPPLQSVRAVGERMGDTGSESSPVGVADQDLGPGEVASASVAALEAGVRLRRHVEGVLARSLRAGAGGTSADGSLSAASADAHAGSAGSTKAGGARGSASATVLVVDDDAHVRSLLRQALEEAEYEVMEAADGIAALEAVREKRPDLVLLDVMMPHLTGFDVAAALKGDLETRSIPIVVLSVIEDAQRGYRLGVERYLTKPVDVAALVADVAALLRPQEHPGSELAGAHVALVEDEEDSATERSLVMRAEAALRSAGYAVSLAPSVAAAADLEPPVAVVVLSRAAAARTDGLDLARRHSRLRDSSVVVLT